VRFLVGAGWLAHYNFSGERMLPPMPALLQAPFWLDPIDPHRMRSAIQLLIKPPALDWYTPFDLRHRVVADEGVWPTAVRRVVTEDISPGQALDEAIARTERDPPGARRLAVSIIERWGDASTACRETSLRSPTRLPSGQVR
jgi:hypothetical protein